MMMKKMKGLLHSFNKTLGSDLDVAVTPFSEKAMTSCTLSKLEAYEMAMKILFIVFFFPQLYFVFYIKIS